MTEKIKLSKRQLGDADRVGGIELMILWPASLGPEPHLDKDDEREATPQEKSTAERLVREAIIAAGRQPDEIIPVHTRVACVHRVNSLPSPGYRVHLAVTLIGRRWVHASTKSRGRVTFAQPSDER